MEKKLVIFDMDGTILDTLDDLTDALNYALSYHHLPLRTKEEVRLFLGNGIQKLVERGVPSGTEDADTRKVFDTFRVYYQQHCYDKTKPYPGILHLMKVLKENNYLIAVISNKADSAVQELCRIYFEGLIDYAAGEREGIRKKPAPDAIFSLLETLQVKKSSTIYIGDSEVDIKTARNAGIDYLIVTWGFRERTFLEEQGAKVFADTAGEAEQLLISGASLES